MFIGLELRNRRHTVKHPPPCGSGAGSLEQVRGMQLLS